MLQGNRMGAYIGCGGSTLAFAKVLDRSIRLISESLVQMTHPGSDPFGLQGEIQKMASTQEVMDAKALAASKSHSEAERTRRERISNHLAKLRSLLPSTIKVLSQQNMV